LWRQKTGLQRVEELPDRAEYQRCALRNAVAA
jgi:hypothetical protein